MDEIGMHGDVAQEQGRPRLAHVYADPAAPRRRAGPRAARHPVAGAADQRPVLGEVVHEHAASAEGPRQLLERAVQHRVDVERAVERSGRLVQERQAAGEGLGLALAAPRLLEEPRVLQRDRRVVGQCRYELNLAHGEIVRLEEVHDQDAVRLLAGGDGRPRYEHGADESTSRWVSGE